MHVRDEVRTAQLAGETRPVGLVDEQSGDLDDIQELEALLHFSTTERHPERICLFDGITLPRKRAVASHAYRMSASYRSQPDDSSLR